MQLLAEADGDAHEREPHHQEQRDLFGPEEHEIEQLSGNDLNCHDDGHGSDSDQREVLEQRIDRNRQPLEGFLHAPASFCEL
ncbi:hypothetical protein D3C73_1592040 [compost metagenome]